ncbi:uncharacterized protein LOC143449360 [Clavelina lepadiformis]|uniref:uncharacterized protein LOC143449360 n=1 Tax=Clavelina lepadiformis TaxID=159417 RepID=UPI0040418398
MTASKMACLFFLLTLLFGQGFSFSLSNLISKLACLFTTCDENSSRSEEPGQSTNCIRFNNTMVLNPRKYVNYDMTTKEAWDRFLNMSGKDQQVLRLTVNNFLDGNCNCKNRLTEIFYHFVLPECVANSELSSSKVILPCFQYCNTLVYKCLLNASDTQTLSIRNATGQNTEDFCKDLPHHNCWNNSEPLINCTGQREVVTYPNNVSKQPSTVIPNNQDDNAIPNDQVIIIACSVSAFIVLILVAAIILRVRSRKGNAQRKPIVGLADEVQQQKSSVNAAYNARDEDLNLTYNTLDVGDANPASKPTSSKFEDCYDHINVLNAPAKSQDATYLCAEDVSKKVDRVEADGEFYTQVNK